MRALLFDELGPQEVAKVRAHLENSALPSALDGLYWVELDDSLLTAVQADHQACQPHRFAVEVGPDFVKLELFIRPAQGLRCHCAGYATPRQRRFILEMADRLIEDLSLQT